MAMAMRVPHGDAHGDDESLMVMRVPHVDAWSLMAMGQDVFS